MVSESYIGSNLPPSLVISRVDCNREGLSKNAEYALAIIGRNPKQLKISDLSRKLMEDKKIGFNLALEAVAELEERGLVRKNPFGRYYQIRYRLTQLI